MMYVTMRFFKNDNYKVIFIKVYSYEHSEGILTIYIAKLFI